MKELSMDWLCIWCSWIAYWLHNLWSVFSWDESSRLQIGDVYIEVVEASTWISDVLPNAKYRIRSTLTSTALCIVEDSISWVERANVCVGNPYSWHYSPWLMRFWKQFGNHMRMVRMKSGYVTQTRMNSCYIGSEIQRRTWTFFNWENTWKCGSKCWLDEQQE